MDWSSVAGIVMAVLVGIGLPLALRKRQKAGPLKREELCQHLHAIGVRARLADKGSPKEKIGLSRSSGQRSEGIIELEDKNIDAINVISIASQYGVTYHLDYLVKTPNLLGSRSFGKTQLHRKKKPPLWGRVVDIEWKGDKALAQSLNFDYSLKDRLLQADAGALKQSILVIPEPKHSYARIRTAYALPSQQLFEAIAISARHLKSS
jgi:hypothetical protein